MSSTATASYTRTAKILHWLIALLIIGMLALGWTMHSFQGGTKFVAFQLHKSLGITILLLSLFRLAWRLTHTPPELSPTMPRWEQLAAHFGHLLLYAAMIVMPLSGWIMVSASEHHMPTILYGLVEWPAFPGVADSPNRAAIDDATDSIHYYLAFIFAALIVGHVTAALKHHFISKDDILLRIYPRCCANFLNRIRGQA